LRKHGLIAEQPPLNSDADAAAPTSAWLNSPFLAVPGPLGFTPAAVSPRSATTALLTITAVGDGPVAVDRSGHADAQAACNSNTPTVNPGVQQSTTRSPTFSLGVGAAVPARQRCKVPASGANAVP